MDMTDAEIMRYVAAPAGFNWNPRESMAVIAQQVGIDEDTVRARIKKMKDHGVMQDWHVVINASVFGHQMSRIQTGPVDESNKAALRAQLALVDGVQWIFDLFQAGFGVVLYHASDVELERRRSLVGQITGTDPRVWEIPMPPVEVTLDAKDWRILGRMLDDPRVPLSELATASGCSTKTVKRRLDRLADGKVAFTTGGTDLSKLQSGIIGEFRVYPAEDAAPGPLREHVRSIRGASWTNVEGLILLTTLVRPTIGALTNVRDALQERPDAQRVEMDVLVARHTVGEWMRERVHEAVARAD